MSPDIIITIIMSVLVVIYQSVLSIKRAKDGGYASYPLIIPNGIMCLMLLAAPFNWPYDYYKLLRIVILAGCVCNIVTLYKMAEYSIIPLFVVLGVLFNPVIPIHLTKDVWMYIDIIAIVIIVLSTYYSFGFSSGEELSNVEEESDDT